jgi:putative transposase
MNEKTSPSDLPDEEWEWIKEVSPAAPSGGRPRPLGRRAVLQAIFAVAKGGLPWRMVPTHCPTGQSVSHDLRPWKRAGGWGRVHDP